MKEFALNAGPARSFSLRERHELNRRRVSRIDLSKYSQHVANNEHRNYFFDTNFKEHYQLIAHLSTRFDYSIIFDIGTCLGYSALALSYNPKNTIVSYDIVENKQLYLADQLINIEYRIGDVLADARLLGAAMIMLDTNHDGIFEKKLYLYLKENHFRGLLFLDDIYLNQQMREFWRSISEAKEDITELGHWSGSGLVDFSC